MRETIISFPNNTAVGTVNRGIASGTCKLTRLLCSGDLEYGQCNSDKFEVQLYDITENLVGEKIVVSQRLDDDTTHVLFTGFVDSCEQNAHAHYSSLVAYDAIGYYRNREMADWWKDYWTTNDTTTILDLAKSAITYVGIEYSIPNTITNGNLTISKPAELDSISFGTLLEYIGGITLSFPHMNVNGVLELVQLHPSESIEITDTQYKKGTSDFERYISGEITRVQFFNDDNDIVGIAGNAGNTYSFDDNLLLHSLEKDEMQTLASDILPLMQGYGYTPCKIELIFSMPLLTLGQSIIVNGKQSYIFSAELSGVLMLDETITTKGNQLYEGTVDYNSNVQYTKDKASQILQTLEAEYIKTDVADIKYATVTNLNATNANITKLTAREANFEEATANNFTAVNGNITNLQAKDAEIDKALINKADIDLANINDACIKTAMIDNGAITTALIKQGAIVDSVMGDISANHLTAGELNADKVTINNLKAKNIIVEKINGKEVSGSVEDMFTADTQRMDSLQSQIDGAIETWQSTTVPTMVSYPTTEWSESDYGKHVGDVCYVVNDAIPQNGYTYRFYYDGTTQTYSWTLIKDSEITSALKDISDIKTFDADVSKFMDETDDSITSLITRTTTIEGNLGDFTQSKFNEVSQTVDSNSASIKSMSTELSTKADGEAVETLTNRVSTVEQTANGLTSSVSSLSTQVTKVISTVDTVMGYTLEIVSTWGETLISGTSGWYCEAKIYKNGVEVTIPNATYTWYIRSDSGIIIHDKVDYSYIEYEDYKCGLTGTTIKCTVNIPVYLYLLDTTERYILTPDGKKIVVTI